MWGGIGVFSVRNWLRVTDTEQYENVILGAYRSWFKDLVAIYNDWYSLDLFSLGNHITSRSRLSLSMCVCA